MTRSGGGSYEIHDPHGGSVGQHLFLCRRCDLITGLFYKSDAEQLPPLRRRKDETRAGKYVRSCPACHKLWLDKADALLFVNGVAKVGVGDCPSFVGAGLKVPKVDVELQYCAEMMTFEAGRNGIVYVVQDEDDEDGEDEDGGDCGDGGGNGGGSEPRKLRKKKMPSAQTQTEALMRRSKHFREYHVTTWDDTLLCDIPFFVPQSQDQAVLAAVMRSLGMHQNDWGGGDGKEGSGGGVGGKSSKGGIGSSSGDSSSEMVGPDQGTSGDASGERGGEEGRNGGKDESGGEDGDGSEDGIEVGVDPNMVKCVCDD